MSDSTKFTPGPWKACKGVEEADDMRCGVTVSRGKVEYLLATIENGAPGDFCDTEYANARLIAAAPCMFEALQFIYEHIADPERTLLDLYPAFGLDGSRALAMARDALAKARGETSLAQAEAEDV